MDKTPAEFTTTDLLDFMHAPQASQCACGTCRGMCERAPCIATPQDILRMINAGLAPMLRMSTWAPFGPETAIDMIAIDGGRDIIDQPTPCPFLRAGRCSLHESGLKPTEGKRASCQHSQDDAARLLAAVAGTWILPRNRRLVKHLFALFEPPTNTETIHL